ncbi:MAG: ornithine cyclodeaminase family protein, partial [Saprospiraceae bacterium]|nr:ornithine cyclodeaminase family protein [Saprospiraceae bacterium]
MEYISADKLEELLNYPDLVDALRNGFRSDYDIPQRVHHDYPNPEEKSASTLLLMPAWRAGHFLGVKIITVSPHNGEYDRPSIQGIY